ncbi:MAG: transcriptional regulator [Gammaproteobacteria bacterium]|nr:transcriptional regulator [Gammaproteobacteria bacterium]
MPGRRHYRDPCPIARALDLLGERWALLIVRELLPGPKRFTDLRAGLDGVSPNVLSQRLEELESGAVIERRLLPPPAASQVYELTHRGRELEPILLALARFGHHCPAPDETGAPSPTSVILQLQAGFRPEAAAGIKARVSLQLGAEAFAFRITKKELRSQAADNAAPDLTIQCQPEVMLAVVRGQQTLTDALAADQLRLGGDAAMADTFIRLFRLP